MSNRGGIDSQIVELLEADHQIIFLAVKAEFDTETLLLWTGDTDLVINSETYTGVGSLLSVGDVEDTLELKTTGVSLTLAGMDSTIINLALNENYVNRNITIFTGFLSGGTDHVQGTMTLFKGRIQSMTIADDPQGATIQLQCENRLIDLDRPSNLRFTKDSQTFINADDTCFSRVQNMQDKEIVWGQATSSGGGGGGGGGPGTRNDIVNNQIMHE